MKISACLIVKNEEENIRECLENIKDIVDEIIIVDDYSQDKTVEICKGYTDKIYLQKRTESFAEKKNFSLSKARGDWILFIDADERLSEELKNIIKTNRDELLSSKKYDGYAFSRRNYLTPDGKKQIWLRHGTYYPDYQIRLFKNKKEIRYRKWVHEMLTIDKERVKKIEADIIHQKRFSNMGWANFKGHRLRYAKTRAREIIEKRKITRWECSRYLCQAAILPLKLFLKDYFYHKGFLGGVYGLIGSIQYAMEDFFVYLYVIKLSAQKYEVARIRKSFCSFNREDVVLDAGTGKGYFLNHLASKSKLVYAVDINPQFLEKIKQKIRGENIVLLNEDLANFSFNSNYFDKILCLEVLEHCPEPLKIIKELSRVLKPNGVCVIAVPTFFSEKLYSSLNPHYDQNKGEHISIFEKSKWASLFRRGGFKVIATVNENFEHALHWVLRNMFPIDYDPSSGEFLEEKIMDKLFLGGMDFVNKITLGAFYGIGNRIFPKSWYFYLTKKE